MVAIREDDDAPDNAEQPMYPSRQHLPPDNVTDQLEMLLMLPSPEDHVLEDAPPQRQASQVTPQAATGPPPRTADRNWARVRQKVVGIDIVQPEEDISLEPRLDPTTEAPVLNRNLNKLPLLPLLSPNYGPRPLTSVLSDAPKSFAGASSSSSNPPGGEGTGTLSTGLRGVLGFRTVVVQRTQLRKMEKEIEKALARHATEQSQPRSRTVPRIATGTRGMVIPGGTYNMMTAPENQSVDRAFLDDLSDILARWKSLAVEVPCKAEIYKAFSKMLRADRAESMSRAEAAVPLNLFDQMRQQYPTQNDQEDLQDVLWCLSLLSPKFQCNKDRVVHMIRELLSAKSLHATLPLSSRNIYCLLATIVPLMYEHENLAEEAREPRIQTVTNGLIARLREGDLGVGKIGKKDRLLHVHTAQVAFLRGLIECLRLRNQNVVQYLVHELIPKYWVEPASIYSMTMDGPVRIYGQVASEFILSAPVAFADCSEMTKSLIEDFVLFFEEYLPPASLKAIVSKDSILGLIKFILMVFSIEYLEGQHVEKPALDNFVEEVYQDGEDIRRVSRESEGAGAGAGASALYDSTPRVSISTDYDREIGDSRTPPRTPLSPNVSGEGFQARTMPSHHQNLVADEEANPAVRHARAYFNALLENGFQNLIVDQLKIEMEDVSFPRLVNLYHRVILGSSRATSSQLLAATLPTFFNKMVAHQPEPTERLSKLLLALSIHHRTLFFKPMIACVASDSTQVVTDYLCILSCLEMHVGLVDLYMRDADLICVIMMTDVGPERPRLVDPSNQALRWGSCTVGQCVIILEFIYAIKRLARSGDHHDIEVGKMFLIDVERKLGLYLISKEKKVLVPRPIRVMLCLIFYEIRMLCKTIHRPGWLPRILDWAVNHDLPAEPMASDGRSSGISDTMRLRIKHIYSSVDGLVVERKDRYTMKPSTLASQPTRNTSTLKKDAHNDPQAGPYHKSKTFSHHKRIGRMPDIRLDETVAVLTLLITVHSAIHVNEFLQLVYPLWHIHSFESRPKAAASAAFLFVKCADIAPKTIHSMVTRDLTSEDPNKRLSAVERLHSLFDHRNVLLSQPFVIDPSSSKGPFRHATIQVPFVATEVGSNLYTMDEPRWLSELKSASNFPVDVRNRFRELGWGERDLKEMEMTKRAQTPLMLSWSGYLDSDTDDRANFGRTYTLIPKDRHATVLIPVLNALNLSTIDLLNDRTVGVRTAVISFLTDYIRNEPVLFVRSFFVEIFHSRPDRQRELVGQLHMLISATSKLPPAFAYALFNHLLGLLKWFQRNAKPLGHDMMATVLPLLADVVCSSNDIVFKDFKRNKVDVFLSKMGRFWFKPKLVPGSMFPSELDPIGQAKLVNMDIPHQLFQMTMVNISQIHFMTNFLVRFPLEAPDIKASLAGFRQMPRLNQAKEIDSRSVDTQYLPDMAKDDVRFVSALTSQERSVEMLSRLRARAWLCFIINLIQRMEKSSCSRLELMTILNGVNVVLMEHGDDLGIIGQALDIYVTAASRHRRFFAAYNGYNLFFPALFKIYCDSSRNKVVQDTIDAAYYRFYQLHQEAFVLQSLGSIVPLMLRKMSEEQSKVMTRQLYAFLEALDQPTTTLRSKALGVESLADPFRESSRYGGPQLEIPQWMSSFIPKDSKLFQSSNLLHKREFTIADSIKLFLAVIAFDPGSVRSEQFVRVLTKILPFFLENDSQLMTPGLDSLIDVFARFSRTSRPLLPQSYVCPPVAPRPNRDQDDATSDVSRFALLRGPLAHNQAVRGKTWAQNDRVAIKHEFMCLIQEFCERGGQLADSQHQMMAALAKSIVKDYMSLKIPCTTEWLKDYINSAILPMKSLHQSSRAVLYLIVQFHTILKTTCKSVDFSGLLQGLTIVVEDDRRYLRNSLELAHVYRERIVNPALAICVKGDWVADTVHVSQANFCSHLVDLVLAMVSNADTDTLAELEQAEPTPRLIAFIVIPMCLRFKSRFQANCLDILEMQFWLRMLGLTVKAAEYDPTSSRTSRTAGLFAPVLNVARSAANIKNQHHFLHHLPLLHGGDVSPLAMSPKHVPTPIVTAPSLPHTPQVLQTPLPPQTPGHLQLPSFQRDDQGEDEAQRQQPQQRPSPTATMNASPGLLVDFIALRIIMVRGEKYLSFHPGCWLDIFNIVRKYFSNHALTAFGGQSNNGGAGIHPISQGGSFMSHLSHPATPNPSTTAPATPGVPDGGPLSSRWRYQSYGSSLSPLPSMSRSSADISHSQASMYAKESFPTTALGYVLWCFAETILFNRLPILVMMRPFLQDQLRHVQLHSLQGGPASAMRVGRSMGSSAPASPAFYWPSPAFGPSFSSLGTPSQLPQESQDQPPLTSPAVSPLQLRSDGRRSSGSDFTGLHSPPTLDASAAKLQRQQQQRAERREQWKSWSKPIQTMKAYTEIEKPYQGSAPMSPNMTLPVSGVEGRSGAVSFVDSNPADGRASISSQPRTRRYDVSSENPASSNGPRVSAATPAPTNRRQSLRHPHHLLHRHQRGAGDLSAESAENMLPDVLVDRANRSMDHVRTMLSSTLAEGAATVEAAGLGSSEFGSPSFVDRRFRPFSLPFVGGSEMGSKSGTGSRSSSSLSPMMALQDRRESPLHASNEFSQGQDGQFPPQIQQPQQQQQFLLPVKYERQPVSPGFGSLYLAREAAMAMNPPTINPLESPVGVTIGSADKSPFAPASPSLTASPPLPQVNPSPLSATGTLPATSPRLNRVSLMVPGSRLSHPSTSGPPRLNVESDRHSELPQFVVGSPALGSVREDEILDSAPLHHQHQPHQNQQSHRRHTSVPMISINEPPSMLQPSSALGLGLTESNQVLDSGSASAYPRPSPEPPVMTSRTLPSSAKKGKGILKPRIITTSPPRKESDATLATLPAPEPLDGHSSSTSFPQQHHHRLNLHSHVHHLPHLHIHHPPPHPHPHQPKLELDQQQQQSILLPATPITPVTPQGSVGSLSFAPGESPIRQQEMGAGAYSGRVDSLEADTGGGGLGSRFSVDHRPSIPLRAQEDYRVASTQGRTKIFLQNIEEETRVVLACFPRVFSITVAPAPPVPPMVPTLGSALGSASDPAATGTTTGATLGGGGDGQTDAKDSDPFANNPLLAQLASTTTTRTTTTTTNTGVPICTTTVTTTTYGGPDESTAGGGGGGGLIPAIVHPDRERELEDARPYLTA